MKLTLIQGDCSKILPTLPENSVDLVITDPPYSKKYLYLYQYIADFCPRLMKEGSSLLTIVGHYAIPEVIKIFNNTKLKYRWIICLNQFSGKHARMGMGIEVMWKPMLWFVKGKLNYKGFIRDGVKITGVSGQSKPLHVWQQDLDWCTYFIKKLTKEGDTVLDPFLGSGTVMEACKNLNRNCIGIEINKNTIKIVKERLLWKTCLLPNIEWEFKNETRDN